MTIDEAASTIDKKYRRETWYDCVGVRDIPDDAQTIILYVNSLNAVDKKAIEAAGQDGFSVVVKLVENQRPILSEIHAEAADNLGLMK